MNSSPSWNRHAHISPLTYEVEGLRAQILAGGDSVLGLPMDFAVPVAALAGWVSITGRIYPHIVT